MPIFSILYVCLFIGLASLLYYLTSSRLKPYFLLFISLVFITYISFYAALFALVFTIVNYFFAIKLEEFRNNPTVRIKFFWMVITIDVGILCFFKFFIFFSNSFNYFNSIIGNTYLATSLSFVLPLGISYYIFQTLGYIIRINRGIENAERNFVFFGSYLLFFPKFLSGPVERSNHFLPQIKSIKSFKSESYLQGCRLILWGLMKKVVIANNLYGPVNQVYNSVHDYSGISLITVLLVQTIYIYYDFSGYADMAIGTAKLFNINLAENFNRPYLSKSVSEFWRRWHMSLSSWCNDFIYNPFIVKYRRYGNVAVVVGIFLTFFVVGIWHGTNWKYVALGLLQGIAIVYEFYTKRWRLKFASRFSKGIVNTFSRLLVFLFVCITMVFFFSKSISDAWYFITHLLNGIQLGPNVFDFIMNKPMFSIALLCFLVLMYVELLKENGKDLLAVFLKQHYLFQWVGYLVCILVIYLFNNGLGSFYYMRF